MPAHEISGVDVNAIPVSEGFVIDANILFFLHSGFYTSASGKARQISEDSSFISKLLLRGNRLVVPTTVLQEFLHGFERKSYRLYLSANGLSADRRSGSFFSLKQYRAIASERSALQVNIDRALYEVVAQYDYTECRLRLNDIDGMVGSLSGHRDAARDFLTVAECKREGLLNYISDDSDFLQDTSIHVYYAT